MQGVILEIFYVLDLKDIFLLEILVVLLFLDYFLVGGVNEVMCELVSPDVDEVDYINDQHGEADDQDCQGVVEEMGVEGEEGVQDGVEGAEVAICAFLVDGSLEPVVVYVYCEDVAQSQSHQRQFSQYIHHVSHHGVAEVLYQVFLFVADGVDCRVDDSSESQHQEFKNEDYEADSHPYEEILVCSAVVEVELIDGVGDGVLFVEVMPAAVGPTRQ